MATGARKALAPWFENNRFPRHDENDEWKDLVPVEEDENSMAQEVALPTMSSPSFRASLHSSGGVCRDLTSSYRDTANDEYASAFSAAPPTPTHR